MTDKTPEQPTLAAQIRTLAGLVETLEEHRDYASQEIRQLRGNVSILWEVAYEGFERGAAFYALVERRTGQTREQAERHFLPDNTPIAQPVQPATGCACKWNGELSESRCELHEAWHVAILEWSDRAKAAEAKLAQPVQPADATPWQVVRAALVAEIEHAALNDMRLPPSFGRALGRAAVPSETIEAVLQRFDESVIAARRAT